jgi:branched-subunit amino acid aminotransferase/4-amino-4-deoxychorismate lyase
MYGESVFTTLRMVDGDLKDWNLHFERLKKGAEFLYGPFEEKEEWAFILKNKLDNLLNDYFGNKIVRITLYREQARGLNRQEIISINSLKLHVNGSDLEPNRFENKKLRLRTCHAISRPYWWPSFLKAGNYLETILSQKMYMKPQDDDVLFLSPRDTVLESSVANIFIVRHNNLYTSPPGPNVLEGVMRKKVIDVALDYFDDFEESETSMDQLVRADAIFGSNSVRGLFLVDRIDDYEITYSEEFLNKFQRLKDKVLL